MYSIRRASVLEKMNENNVDLMVFVPGSNLAYITGHQFSPSERLLLYFLQSNGQGSYIVPELEKTTLNVTDDDRIFAYSDEKGPHSVLQQLKKQLGLIRQIGVEEHVMRLFEWKFINELGIHQMMNGTTLLKDLRIEKDAEEIIRMRRAVQVLEESLQATLPSIKAGKKEIEIAARLEYEMKMRGSQGTPFSTIVASGSRGALPHGRASDKVIEDGDFIVIDFGALVDGYVADMTRTIGVGSVSKQQREVYNVVKDAITQSIRKIELGMRACDIDAIARQIITEAGYGVNFTHRLGHGIGLDGHEDPYIASSNEEKITSGMSFTIEPGIYIEGQFGVRIEDNIVATDQGIKNLMTMDYELIIV